MPKSSSATHSRKLFQLAVAGGAVFWATTIVISLLPIAAEYRAAFSTGTWSAQTVWVASLPVGMLVAGCVSYFLLRIFDKLPARDPILKSALLGCIALAMATILIDAPRSGLHLPPGDVLHYFLIGLVLNAPRFLFLGIAIGYLYKRLDTMELARVS